MKIDFEKYEGLLVLATDSNRGIWASSLLLRRGQSIRTAGQLPVDASAASLGLIALATTLKSISRAQVAKLEGMIPHSVSRPRIQVASEDIQFVNALNARITKDKAAIAANPLRSGKNFTTYAASAMARFQLNLVTPDEGDMVCMVLKTWAQQHVHSEKILASIPMSLAPRVLSTLQV